MNSRRFGPTTPGSVEFSIGSTRITPPWTAEASRTCFRSEVVTGMRADGPGSDGEGRQ